MKRFVVLFTSALLLAGCGHAAPSHSQIASYIDRYLDDCNGYAMYGQCAIIDPTSGHCLSVSCTTKEDVIVAPAFRRYLLPAVPLTGDLILTPAGERRFYQSAETNVYMPLGLWLIAPAYTVADSVILMNWPDGSTTATATVRFALDPSLAAFVRAGGSGNFGTGLYALRLLHRNARVTITLPKDFDK